MSIHNQYQRVVPFIVFVLALLLLFKLIQPTITILLGAILLAYITLPLYKKVAKKIPNKFISISLSLLIVLIIILIPFLFLAFEISQEGYYFYKSLSVNIEEGALFGFGCTSSESAVCTIINQAESFSVDKLSTFGFGEQIQKFMSMLEEKITLFILQIPIMLAKVFIAFILAYFIIKDREVIMKKTIGLLPMRKKTTDKLIDEFGDIAHTVIYAQLFIAFIQGILGTIGFYLFGVPFPMILGVTLAFFALIPSIGTAIIWFPASLYLMLMGYFSGNYWILGKGIGLFFYGALIISTIDNIMLAKIVNKRTNVSQILIIVGVIGGVSLFGFIGIFIGPIMLPLLITYFETFKDRFGAEDASDK